MARQEFFKPRQSILCRASRSGYFWILLALGSVGVWSLLCQPHARADQYFASSTLQFSKREYALRRERLCSAVGDGIVLIPSADYPGPSAIFRQDSTFLYFTGLEVPRSYLLLDAATRREVLYLPTRDERFYVPGHENGFRGGRTLYPNPEILSRSGVRDHAPVANLMRDLDGWARAQKIIWVDLGPTGDAPQKETEIGFFPARETLLYKQLYNRFHNPRLKNLYTVVAALRMVKSEAELRVLRKVSTLGTAGMVQAMQSVRPGMSERALEAVLAFAYQTGGAQMLPLVLMVKSGPNSILPRSILAANYDGRNRPMQPGELVIAEAGCELNYYAAAITRTFPTSGFFSEEQRDAYRAVLAASLAAIAAVRPGVTLKQVEDAALAAVPARYRRWWERGIGHSIGLDVVDPADLTRPLAAGMTLMIEPRIYIPERTLGLAIGDVVLVTPTGCEVLTAGAPKEAARVEELVNRRRAPSVIR